MPKSPVAQNLKIASNINLKGKKGDIALSCNCCWIIGDLKDRELNKIIRKEIQDEINNYYNKIYN